MVGVTLEHISKQFGKVWGVSDVHVQIQPGEFFTFLGPSGCGKTTTLRMIAGFYYPTKGRILFGEQEVTQVPPHKRNTGMVFQNYALFPHMTVAENIAFGLQVRRRPRTEIKERVARAQKLLRLENYGSRRIDQLSGGQQQRVALARSLVIEPRILLLDEPLSNLDAKLREETRVEIKRLQIELGITTIYVTHDQSEAMTMSDRIMVMDGGVVQQIGQPQEIYNRPLNRFVASFIGESNLWEGLIESTDGEEVRVRFSPERALVGLKHNASPQCQLRQGEKVTVSIRPETLLEVPDSTRGENIMLGEVSLSEFTGVSVNYLSTFGDDQLKALFVNQGERVKERGEPIALRIPKDSLYFVA